MPYASSYAFYELGFVKLVLIIKFMQIFTYLLIKNAKKIFMGYNRAPMSYAEETR